MIKNVDKLKPEVIISLTVEQSNNIKWHNATSCRRLNDISELFTTGMINTITVHHNLLISMSRFHKAIKTSYYKRTGKNLVIDINVETTHQVKTPRYTTACQYFFEDFFKLTGLQCEVDIRDSLLNRPGEQNSVILQRKGVN